MKSREELRAILEGFTLSEFFALMDEAEEEFNFVSTVFCLEDAEDIWQNLTGEPMPDDAWAKISSSLEWRNLKESLDDTGREIVRNAALAVSLEIG